MPPANEVSKAAILEAVVNSNARLGASHAELTPNACRLRIVKFDSASIAAIRQSLCASDDYAICLRGRITENANEELLGLPKPNQPKDMLVVLGKRMAVQEDRASRLQQTAVGSRQIVAVHDLRLLLLRTTLRDDEWVLTSL